MPDDHDERYTIEPPPERQRELTRDQKIDRILDAVTNSGDSEGTQDAGGAPEVTFEADPEALPTAPDTNEPGGEEGDDPAGQGEGTTNVSDQQNQRKGFRHPSAARRAVIERG